jgi:outer membrane protein OmpA-like peptidoglycan-associated protein
MRSFLILLLFVSFFPGSAQPSPKSPAKPISSDCNKAINLKISNRLFYGMTTPPSGFGVIQEITKKSKNIFEEEHNSAWYLLTIERTGELVFDITPEDTTNDYDFLFYKYSDTSFCESFKNNKLNPLRSNLSNPKETIKGVTGLKSEKTCQAFVGKGTGNPYSASVNVVSGEKYMLIIDNITPEGKGHRLEFNFIKEIEVNGIVLNSNNVPIVSEITLSDQKGQVILETKSNEKGEYGFKTPVKEGLNYGLTIVSDCTFVSMQILNTKSLKTGSEFKDIRTILPILKKGSKYQLNNILFFGGSPVLLPESYSSVESLFKLMKKNKRMVIQIEGHVNDPGGMLDSTDDLLLSKARAKAVTDYLIKKGIDKERIKWIGLSNLYPVFAHPKDDNEEQMNRRVEIKIVSIN